MWKSFSTGILVLVFAALQLSAPVEALPVSAAEDPLETQLFSLRGNSDVKWVLASTEDPSEGHPAVLSASPASPTSPVSSSSRAETEAGAGEEEISNQGVLAEVDYGFLGAPSWVLLRSFLIPAWGQVHNRSWVKALVVAGIEGAMIERLLYERRRLHHYRDLAQARPEEAEFYRGRERRHRLHRRDFIWWTSLIVFMSMWDAYVDAHLKHLDVDLQTDPGIFQDGEIEDSSPELSVRLSLGFNF